MIGAPGIYAAVAFDRQRMRLAGRYRRDPGEPVDRDRLDMRLGGSIAQLSVGVITTRCYRAVLS